MSVTVNQPKQLDSRTWLVSWSSDLSDPTFRIFKDGALVQTTKETSSTFKVDEGENLLIEILDDSSSPQEAYPGRFVIGWYASADTDKYRIEEYVNSTWTERATIKDQGQGFFRWTTRFLEDVTEHQFRIVPVGLNGNDGTPKTLIALMVRHPDIPDVNFSYSDSTETLTISAN